VIGILTTALQDAQEEGSADNYWAGQQYRQLVVECAHKRTVTRLKKFNQRMDEFLHSQWFKLTRTASNRKWYYLSSIYSITHHWG
jgi:hypothetical protein